MRRATIIRLSATATPTVPPVEEEDCEHITGAVVVSITSTEKIVYQMPYPKVNEYDQKIPLSHNKTYKQFSLKTRNIRASIIW